MTATPLADLALFDGVATDDLTPLAQMLTPRRLAPGEVLVRAGDAATFYGILVEGTVSVDLGDRGGTQLVGGTDRGTTVAAGAVIGEIGMLMDRPRSATVTALEPALVLTGDAGAFAQMLSLPGIGDRLRDIATRRIAAHAVPIPVERNGQLLSLRPLLASDRDALAAAAREASAETIRRRFFTPARPGERVLRYLTEINYVDHFAWLLMTPEERVVAVGRYVRLRDEPTAAEVAFTVLDDWQHQGLGSLLMGCLATTAVITSTSTLTGEFLAENDSMRRLFSRVGATYSRPEPGVVAARFSAADAVELLAAELRPVVGRVVEGICGGGWREAASA